MNFCLFLFRLALIVKNAQEAYNQINQQAPWKVQIVRDERMAKEITAQRVLEALLPRRPDSHKGSYGRLLCVLGSSRYRGAAALAAEGALRGGAGLVTLASTEPVIAGVQTRCPECIFLPCKENEEGGISAKNGPMILENIRGCSAFLMGPGLGNTPDTRELLEMLVPGAGCPVVLDADALNAAAQFDDLPKPVGFPLILTPHPGEMARLCGLTVAEIEAGRESIAASFARAQGCVVVLKGHRTLVAGPDGQVWKNTTGNPGLARGGSGDILAGLTAALLAQGLDPLWAACCAVWLHGAAADRCAARLSQQAMLPHDIFADLARLLAENGR